MICNACGSGNLKDFTSAKDHEYFTSEIIYNYLICEDCNLIFLINPYFKDLKKIYPSYYPSYEYEKEENKFFNKIFYNIKNYFDKKIFIECLESFANKKDIKVLDIGGGDGAITKKLLFNKSIKSIDIADIEFGKNIEVNEKVNQIKIRAEDLSFQITKKKYNFIIMLNIIEHVINPKKVMSNIHTLLEDDGICLIKTPNTKSLNFKIFHKKYWGGYHTPRHFNIFNYKNIENILRNFTVIKKIFTQGVPQWHASIVGSLKLKNIIKSNIPVHQRKELFFVTLIFGTIDLFFLKFFKITDQFFILLKKKQN
jgi:2-polyprenyl-3-methyl-5-hydroxy-6-metoxy-1,4-benzoquinol methylase